MDPSAPGGTLAQRPCCAAASMESLDLQIRELLASYSIIPSTDAELAFMYKHNGTFVITTIRVQMSGLKPSMGGQPMFYIVPSLRSPYQAVKSIPGTLEMLKQMIDEGMIKPKA